MKRNYQRIMAPVETAEASGAAAPLGATASAPASTEAPVIDLVDVLASRLASEDAGEQASPETIDETQTAADTETTEETDTTESTESTEATDTTEADEDESADEEEAETEEETEEESEGEDEENEEEAVDLRKLDPKTRAAVQKVIDKVVGKAKARTKVAEAKVAELTATVETANREREQLRSDFDALQAAKVVPAPTKQDPLSNFTDVGGLQRLEENSREFRRWALANQHGGTCPFIKGDDGQPLQLTPEQVGQVLANVTDDLEVHIPRRRMFLQEDAKYNQQTEQLFPMLKDRNHELTIATTDILKHAPELKRFPGARMGAVYYELGRRLVEKHQDKAWDVATGKAQSAPAKAKKPIAPPKVKPGPVPIARGPAVTTRPVVSRDAIHSDDDVTNALAARLGG